MCSSDLQYDGLAQISVRTVMEIWANPSYCCNIVIWHFFCRKEKYYKETDGTLTEEYSAASETTVITRVPTESKTTTAISVCKSHNKEAQIRQQVKDG